MKRILTTILAIIFCAFQMNAQTSNVTFSVDMSTYGGSTANGVFVNGSFNGWCGSCNPMTDADMDGVWEVTLPIPNGTIDYKFTVDGWTDQENLTSGDPCTRTDGGFTNRFLAFSSDFTLPEVCWNSCADCGASVGTSNVTFSVDMNNYVTAGGSTANGVFVNGTFNGWCGSCNPMTDVDMDGVWEVTLPITDGTIQYKFTVDGWNDQESLTSGDPCTFTSGGFTNRVVSYWSDVTTPEVCWNACVNCAALPVELTYFNAKAENNINTLFWQTASEENNSHFEVQRSYDGLEFEVIGIVEGQGTIFDMIDYTFVDEAPFTNSYYRLRQVDFDGQFEYSEIVNVNRRQVGSNDVKVYPNPASDNLTIDFTSNADEEATITITDMTGRVLISQNRNVAQGENQLNIDLAELPQGNYFVQLKSTTTSTIQAIVKQ